MRRPVFSRAPGRPAVTSALKQHAALQEQALQGRLARHQVHERRAHTPPPQRPVPAPASPTPYPQDDGDGESPRTQGLEEVHTLCVHADASRSGYAKRSLLEKWLHNACRDLLDALTGNTILDLLQAHTHGAPLVDDHALPWPWQRHSVFANSLEVSAILPNLPTSSSICTCSREWSSYLLG